MLEANRVEPLIIILFINGTILTSNVIKLQSCNANLDKIFRGSLYDTLINPFIII